MQKNEIGIGKRVICTQGFVGIVEGSEGIIVEDYGTGITIAWDLPGRPYPTGVPAETVARMPAVHPQCPVRDGFDKETELHFLILADKPGEEAH